MLKSLLTLIALLFAAASFAAVDVNTATEAELDGIKGIGPGLSSKILAERKNGEFRDWNDFIGRVSGVGNTSAANFSKEGLTVSGKKYTAAAAAKARARDTQQSGTSAEGKTGHSATTGAGAVPATPTATATQPASDASASKK
ncbi:ComEA family DNA-binding protein [Acidovorax radicis]|uniref:ComEA family DNA-binding protein n=1 Tax=Acidovorax radicis TaxID=758826 RepID=UPI001CFB9AE1|nr:helix-hairpin-helix domain-containing protein [Acidovorax radicis]UCV01125.1 helix-hairpin-helix domain-containing protein [Acidovorax radicis]